MTRADHEQRPTRDRSVLGFRLRHLDLIGPEGSTFLRRRGIEHPRLGGLLLHFLDGPDPGLDLHDHPWAFVSLVLRGGYTEEVSATRDAVQASEQAEWNDELSGIRGSCVRGEERSRPRWSIHRMPLGAAHRITVVAPRTVTRSR